MHDQRLTRELVQDLGSIRAHSSALAGGEQDRNGLHVDNLRKMPRLG
jgi:hypothetical protein